MSEWVDTPLDKRVVCQKRLRTSNNAPQPLDTLPAEWCELLARWVRRGGNSRWETLINDAGTNQVQLAYSLLDWLLRSGWAAVAQQWKHGDWFPQRVELLHLSQLRSALGFRDKGDDTQRWQTIRTDLAKTLCDSLIPALSALDELPISRALLRYELIVALQQWKDEQRSGTRRDFALLARDDTKGLSESEWAWLEQILDLAEFNIERHTPLLLLSAPLTLTAQQGNLELSSCADFAALTPATLQSMTAASGKVRRWHLVENRTSFERVAKQRDEDIGVIWLPGFPPSWWCIAVGKLLNLAPAPAYIACDPDPAGIAIALKASALWQEHGLDWHPWKMTATDLAHLRVRKPLTEADKLQLESLRNKNNLPSQLLALLEWMLEHSEKGEQEGYL
jgi:hypothetical protein